VWLVAAVSSPDRLTSRPPGGLSVRPTCDDYRVTIARPSLTNDPEASARALVDRSGKVGVCSTRPSLTGETHEAGVDTLRLLYRTRNFAEHTFDLEGWKVGSIPALSLTWAEGHPVAGELATAEQVATCAEKIEALLDERLGVDTFAGVARLDLTATHSFDHPNEARAFFGGMAVLELPRCETTRRGKPVHSISWSHARGARKLARVYDKGMERGGEAFKFGRMEDQRRFPSGCRPTVESVADVGFMRSKFHARFAPIWKQVNGVKAASFPVVAQAIADEAKYGYRPAREAERLVGALVLLTAGAGEAYSRPTMYRRRAELRDAGFIVADCEEAVEVDLGGVLEAALDSPHWGDA
jgi:hypothetical protein